MMHTNRLPAGFSSSPNELLYSVLENAEVGVVVVDAAGTAIYMNSSARSLLDTRGGLPEWTGIHLTPMLAHVRATGGQCVERWPSSDAVLRVRARPVERGAQEVVLEVSVAHAAGGSQAAENLSRSLKLSASDGRLLALLWRGMSNEEIAASLNVRVGTVKSRLFRLYQKLGVKRRPAAVLRAAEILAS